MHIHRELVDDMKWKETSVTTANQNHMWDGRVMFSRIRHQVGMFRSFFIFFLLLLSQVPASVVAVSWRMTPSFPSTSWRYGNNNY